MSKIGIVGGGIAGLYCALKLGEKKHNVTLYELLDHVGGRIETLNLKGFKAECGPMRFELATQNRLVHLAKEILHIEFKPFSNPWAEPAEYPKYDLKPHEMSTKQRIGIQQGGTNAYAAMFSHHTSSLDLLGYGVYRLLTGDLTSTLPEVIDRNGKPKSKLEEYADNLTDEDYDEIRTEKVVGRRWLYTLGFWNALTRVLSLGAVDKIRDTGTFYHLMPENPSASEWSIFWLRLFRSDASLSTIDEGVRVIVDRLEEQLAFHKNVNILTRKTVEKISLGSHHGELSLKIASEAELHTGFDHVIFALPAVPLRALMGPFPHEVQTYLEGVIPFTLLKTFVVFKDPWWTELPKAQQGANFLPTREIHYFELKDGSTRWGMAMLYMDRPAAKYWSPFIKTPHTKAETLDERNYELKRELARQLASIWPKPSNVSEKVHRTQVEDKIVDFAIRDWSHPPFEAACHAWAAHIDVRDALNTLKAFSLRDDWGRQNLHVCGEAYSNYQGFIEGSLRSADSVLATIPDN